MGETLEQNRRIGLRAWQHAAVFVAACAILISRRPDSVIHSQFWAEDGRVLYAEAYNLGWWDALFRAYNGYYSTVGRLAASLALLAPFSCAPLILNLIAIANAALPVNLLLSSRSGALGSLRFRAVLAAVYLALPNFLILRHGICEVAWYVSLSAMLVLVFQPATNWASRCFDVSVLMLAGLSGPHCIFLLPIALFLAWKYRDQWRWILTGVLAVSVAIQAYGLLVVNPTGRPQAALGANPVTLVRILGGNVVFAALLGRNGLAVKTGTGTMVFLFCLVLGGIAISTYCCLKSNLEMKLFFAFTAMALAASLLSPSLHSSAQSTAWDQMANAYEIRYWFFPSLVFAWSLIWCAWNGNDGTKVASAVLLVAMGFGIVLNWRLQPYADLDFAKEARTFEAAPPGTVMVIPLNPLGWNMQLVKHAAK